MKIKAEVWKVRNCLLSCSKLQEYKLVQTMDDFIETFPIGLDCDCGEDGEDLVDKIARSKYADNVSDKEGLKKALQSCNEDADDPSLVTMPLARRRFLKFCLTTRS